MIKYVWSYWVENWHDKKTENTIEAAAEDNNSCSYYKIFVSYRQFPVVDDGPTGGEAALLLVLLKEIGSNSFQVKLCQGLTAVIATIAPDNDDEINRKVSNVNAGICCKTIRTSSFAA